MKKNLGPNTPITAFWNNLEIGFRLLDCEKFISGVGIRYAKNLDEENPGTVPEIIMLKDIRKPSVPKYQIEDFVLANKVAA